MKAITSHRLRNGFLLSLAILIGTILIVFANDFIKSFTSPMIIMTKTPTMFIIFLISILITIGAIIYQCIIELLKSESKLKEDGIKVLKNRIDFYNKEISEIEKEIEKLS